MATKSVAKVSKVSKVSAASSTYTNVQIIRDLRRVYAKLDRPFSRREYDKEGSISKSTVERRFGTWKEALRRARLLSKFERYKKSTRAAA